MNTKDPTLWTSEDAARWPIETKIMVDMALDAGREVKVVDAAMVRVDYSNGSWIPTPWMSLEELEELYPSQTIGLFHLEPSTYVDFGYSVPQTRNRPWPSDSVGVTAPATIGRPYETPIDLRTPRQRLKRHHERLHAARPRVGLDGRRRR